MPYLFLGIVLLLSGCAVQKQEQIPAITVAANITPSFAIPDVRERMLYLARQEWELFGRPEVNYDIEPPALTYPVKVTPGHETQPPFFSRIFMYWYTATDLPIIGYEGEIRPWSGALLSGWREVQGCRKVIYLLPFCIGIIFSMRWQRVRKTDL